MSDPNTEPSAVESPAAARLRWRDRWRSIEAQRRAGRTMVAVGLVGAIVAIAGTVSGWLFVGELGSATDDSLEVTIETLDAVDDTIDLAADVLASTTEAVDALSGTLDALSGSFDAGTTAIVDIAGLADTVGPSIEEAASAVQTLETVGGDIDSVLAALSNIPFGPDYDPSAGLGETFGSVADALGPLPDQLSTTAESLTDFTDSAGELQDQLADLAASVQSVSDDLSASDELVDQYRTASTRPAPWRPTPARPGDQRAVHAHLHRPRRHHVLGEPDRAVVDGPLLARRRRRRPRRPPAHNGRNGARS